MTTDNALTTTTRPAHPMLALMDPIVFDQMQRVGKMLALSPLFPEHLRKGTLESAIANGVLVMNMAMRLNEDPLTVAQNVYFVSGKPGWSTAYMISKANQHGVFSDQINWEITGEGESLSVTAHATLAKTGKRVQMTCDMDMAKAEGWTKNTKYKTMPEVMLRYRSAAFLIRMYCPEVMISIPAQVEIELETMRDVTPRPMAAEKATKKPEPKTEPEDAQEVSDKAEPKAEPKGDDKATAAKAKETAEPEMEKPAETKAENKISPELREGLERCVEMITADLLDASSPDEVFDLYRDQIDQMEQLAPDLFKQVQDAAKADE